MADSVTNLVGVGSISAGGEVESDAQALGQILSDAQGLAYDIRSLEVQVSRLLDLDSAPDSTRGLRERMWELRRIRSAQYTQALRVQMLIRTAIRIADRIVRIINNFSRIVGNLSALNVANDSLAQLVHVANNQQIAIVSFQRAEAERHAEEPLIEQAVENITNAVMADWPTR